MAVRVGAALLCVGLAASACTASSSTFRSSSPPRGDGATTSSIRPSTTPASISTRPIPSPTPACPPGCSTHPTLTPLPSWHRRRPWWRPSPCTAWATMEPLGACLWTVFCKATRMTMSTLQPRRTYVASWPLPMRFPAGATSSSPHSIVEGHVHRRSSASTRPQVATFIHQWSDLGPNDHIPLPGRITSIPAAIDLATIRSRLYPTGGVAYPVDADESFCPGP